MSVKSTGQRTFIWIIVVAFVLSSLGFTGLVIWDMTRSKPDSQADQSAQAQQNKENKLEGTKLADFTPIAKVDKLKVIDIKEGTGKVVPPKGANVTAHYTGALAKDGTIFQSSKDSGQPIPFSLDGVIKGWTEGVPGMKEGGVRRLIIPAKLAYGDKSPAPNIPANSDLVFDIELVKVN